MTNSFIYWIQDHSGVLIEILGVVAALVYLYFSIKQKIWLWPFGILTSSFYIFIFFSNRLYADTGLQVYYLVISMYGWYYWLFGGNKGAFKQPRVSRITRHQAVRLFLATLLIYATLVLGLIYIPEFLDIPASDLPLWDALTTAASIVATWMLARKILEHWLVWIVVDAISMGLYIYKGLLLTAGLFLIYTLLAIVGFYQWKKDFKANTTGIPGS